MNDVARERTAKLLLGAFRNIWCDRESDEPPFFNCSRCDFGDGEMCRLKRFLKHDKYAMEYPDGMIMEREEE